MCSINFSFYQPLAMHAGANPANPPCCCLLLPHHGWLDPRERRSRAQPKAKRCGGLVILYSCWTAVDRSGSGSGRGMHPPPMRLRRLHPQPLAPASPTVLGLFLLVSCSAPPALQLQPGRTLAPRPCCTELAPSYPMTSSRIFSLKRADEKRAGRRIALFDC